MKINIRYAMAAMAFMFATTANGQQKTAADQVVEGAKQRAIDKSSDIAKEKAGGTAAQRLSSAKGSAAASAVTSGETRSGPVGLLEYTCWQLSAEAEEDQVAAVMFFYGYLAAQQKVTTLDSGKIEPNVKAVRTACGGKPDLPVIDAFRQALR